MLWIGNVTRGEWERMILRLSRIETQLYNITRMELIEMADLSKLAADIAGETTVIEGVGTLLTALSAAIADLKLHVEDPAAQAAIDALAAQVESNSAALSAAVAANTPA